jgi:hypothetical protein
MCTSDGMFILSVCAHLRHSLWRVFLSDLRAKAGASALCRISARLAW